MGRWVWCLAVVGMVVGGGGMGTSAQEGRGGERLVVMTVGEVEEMMKHPSLPHSLNALAGHLQGTIVYDRPALHQRITQLFKLYFEYETATRVEASLTATRRNIEAIYELHRQQQRRSEVDDLSVLNAHNALLGIERTLFSQMQTRRRLLLDILDVANLIDIQEFPNALTTTSSRDADSR